MNSFLSIGTTTICAAAISVASVWSTAHAGAIRDAALFSGNSLAANDDGSTGAVNLGFAINVSGTSYTTAYVNNNGNITFTGPLGTYTPSGIVTSSTPIIAPFWADVDTRGAGSSLVTYSSSVINTQSVFGVNWINVGYYSGQTDKLNSFQLIVTSLGSGNARLEFNYDSITWETGSASQGVNGFGGAPAHVGYTLGTGLAAELPGSGQTLAFINGNAATGLTTHSLNSTVAGRYIFDLQGGVIVNPPPVGNVPLPATLLLLAAGMVSLLGFKKRA
jgi:Nidogen-like